MNQEQETRDPLNMLVYFPFIGWMYPLAKGYRNNLLISHTKQALLLAVGALSILLGIRILLFFIPGSWTVVRFGLVFLIYAVEAVYLVVAIIGTYRFFKGQKKEFPFLERFLDRIEI